MAGWEPLGVHVAAAALGFLSGSVPVGLVLLRLSGGPDPRSVGSGNLGATNVTRAGGRGLGGVALVAFPQHAWSIVRLLTVAAAVSTALWVLVAHVPPTGWIAPFRWMSPFHGTARRRRRHALDELQLIEAHLGARRQALEGAPPLPPAVLRLLKPLIESALDLEGGSDPTAVRRRCLRPS